MFYGCQQALRAFFYPFLSPRETWRSQRLLRRNSGKEMDVKGKQKELGHCGEFGLCGKELARPLAEN